MSLYIHPENQELLWKIINKCPLFEKMGQGSRNWFKNIVQLFYEKSGESVATLPQLKQINQETILYMVENLNHSTGVSGPPSSTGSLQSTEKYKDNNIHTSVDAALHSRKSLSTEPYTVVPDPYTVVPDPYTVRPPPKMDTNAFGERQKEYNNMLTKPLPPEPNFSEKFTDEAISNMDELIAQHKKQREEELKQYAPTEVTTEISKNI
jgi:hypothetical protein